ncbi:MAG: hypothetical protein GY940_32825 [bacterium]|nr:hypothetical protein [bacterium]
MPKKLKLNLEDLKVESFITLVNEKKQQEVKGGAYTVHWVICMENSEPGFCNTERAGCTQWCTYETECSPGC